jgi:hypothetical protein
VGIAPEQYHRQLEKSVAALLSMYTDKGWKDMRMECKRWYWLSDYEVASHSFDVYALAHVDIPEAKTATHNALYQVRKHFRGGFLHAHKGLSINFQCPIFWTAHLAWLTRLPNIERIFNEASALMPFTYEFRGKEVFTRVRNGRRVLVNTRFQVRNPTTGIFDNGLSHTGALRAQMPALPYSFFFSIRETVNHIWYAVRGGHITEALWRGLCFLRETIRMLFPYYAVQYGKVEAFMYMNTGDIELHVRPATKYGSLSLGESERIVI